MVRFTAVAFATLLAGLAIPCVMAQEAQPGEETRRLALFFDSAAGANFSEQEESLLYESLLVRVGSGSPKLAVVEVPGRDPTASESDRTTLARSLGADSWLRVQIAGDWISVGITVSSYDLLTLQTVFQFGLTKRLLRGAVDLERDFWNEVVAAVEGYYSGAAAAKVVPGEVVLRARPGTRILGAADEVLRADAEGLARVSVQVPLTLSLRAVRPGFFPLEGKYYVTQEQTTLELEQVRGARFAFDVYLNNAIFPGFEFSWFPLPSTLFLRTGFTTYLAGLLFSDRGEGDTSIFVSKTLNLLDLGFGAYLNDADRSIRAYAGVGAFLRLITSLGYFGLEPIAPWGLQGVFGIEYSRRLKQRFYLEYDPLLYFTSRPDLLAASFPRDQSPIGYLFFPTAAVYLLNVRLGFRWQI